MTKHVFFSVAMVTIGVLVGPLWCVAEDTAGDPTQEAREALAATGLAPRAISLKAIHEGRAPEDFQPRTGAAYTPSFNEEPSIPAQCWIETGYGTQNACLYCHTNYLASIEHGNAYPLAEDQVLYSFPTPDLNKVLWRNTIFPEEIVARLEKAGITLPDLEDVAYVRQDNWTPLYARVRADSDGRWVNRAAEEFVLFPALNPKHLFPETPPDPTAGGKHGYVDGEGFVRDEQARYTGWRAVNFFPYGIFTPLNGSVSGIYLRLSEAFMQKGGAFDLKTYQQNLDLLERSIKNRDVQERHYYGDAATIPVEQGFFPVGTEFAHPLHYVDLNADGQTGEAVDGVADPGAPAYEFPGTRAKRIKEMRYMYKWKSVGIGDIDDSAHYDGVVIGNEGQGWIDNNVGWVLAGYIEDRQGQLRPQTTEEMMQCLGCHGMVGNTIDSVWSLPRKLPGDLGWREMAYGGYDSSQPDRTKLMEYCHKGSDTGELGFFYRVVVGADLYGVMPEEIARELKQYAAEKQATLALRHEVDAVFDDHHLSHMPKDQRKSHLRDRQKVMRAFVEDRAYLQEDEDTGHLYIKGTLFYPSETTMKKNIQLYRKIVLDQSYNLGKDVFGTEEDNVPFTFRSDGSVKDASGRSIPVGEIIVSRPYDEAGVGTTPTGIVAVNEAGEPVDADGTPVDLEEHPEQVVGHISTGGTFDAMYNPILNDTPITRNGK